MKENSRCTFCIETNHNTVILLPDTSKSRNNFHMLSKYFFLVSSLCCNAIICSAQKDSSLSINGFSPWITGRDSATVQYIPSSGYNALVIEDNKTVAHVKFKVAKYGEVSFPIKPMNSGTEAPSVDLSKSRFVKITYKSNVSIVLQLRQTGVHGGIHNHVVLPASSFFTQQTIYFSSFSGGLKQLDLSDAAKFNFALLENNSKDGFAELTISSFKIDRYRIKLR